MVENDRDAKKSAGDHEILVADISLLKAACHRLQHSSQRQGTVCGKEGQEREANQSNWSKGQAS